MEKKRLPFDVAPGFNPFMWDKVSDNGKIVAALTLTASGKKKMREKGWFDAVDGKEPHNNLPTYVEGYNEGLRDLIGNR